MIYRHEILKGRDKTAPLDDQQEKNLEILLERLNRFRADWGKPITISSGYRTEEINAKAHGSKKSWHLFCAAADLYDPDRALAKHFMNNQGLLLMYDFWMEHPAWTMTWVHLQIYPPSSGTRVFRPYLGEPPTDFYWPKSIS